MEDLKAAALDFWGKREDEKVSFKFQNENNNYILEDVTVEKYFEQYSGKNEVAIKEDNQPLEKVSMLILKQDDHNSVENLVDAP